VDKANGEDERYATRIDYEDDDESIFDHCLVRIAESGKNASWKNKWTEEIKVLFESRKTVEPLQVAHVKKEITGGQGWPRVISERHPLSRLLSSYAYDRVSGRIYASRHMIKGM